MGKVSECSALYIRRNQFTLPDAGTLPALREEASSVIEKLTKTLDCSEEEVDACP